MVIAAARFESDSTTGNRRNDADNVVGSHGRLVLLKITDILVIQIDIYEAPNLAVIRKEVTTQLTVLSRQAGQSLSHRFCFDLDGVLLPCVLP
jgi:hypothetical protein